MSSALLPSGSQDADALQCAEMGNSRADRFVVIGERFKGWSVHAGVTLMEMTVIRPQIFMIGSLRLNKQTGCGLEDCLFTQDQRMIRAFVPRNDAAGHSESLNGRILQQHLKPLQPSELISWKL